MITIIPVVYFKAGMNIERGTSPSDVLFQIKQF